VSLNKMSNHNKIRRDSLSKVRKMAREGVSGAESAQEKSGADQTC
jgi:hypothetical protein